MKRPWIPQAIASAMLLWALYPDNPYGYYVLLRLVCCAVFAWLAIQAYSKDKAGWAWTLAITAVVYNPLIRIHLTREIWSVINLATIGIAAVSAFVLKSPHEGIHSGDEEHD
jgi:hypothetical protein